MSKAVKLLKRLLESINIHSRFLFGLSVRKANLEEQYCFENTA